ncbi:MAG: DNA repair protein RadA [Candidatus Cloacimonetes bacterium]|nr:DNA repair protein RadA [Candidatus Cloacimonadota bacterium]MCF7813504.1 DNA repair protein RadA [Candidatus Cloacimonadota bacterium]MCF7868573.1 DNA repair protein RadA [Candidatus Cloacimonadota bacterium]MCF7883361.1 DNA repair protein RadA [Candidatus Cloacimonadota bacterium]
MFFCTECGSETSKWSGKCPACGAWNTLKETTRVTGKKKNQRVRFELSTQPEKIINIKADAKERISTTIGELDGTLGGGIVSGMVVLIGGEPGIGKSTLMMQVANILADKRKVLYVSGEESKQQIKMRSVRLECTSEELLLYCENDAEAILNTISDLEPEFVVIDSIQSIYMNSIDSAPGSVSQLRECTGLLTRIAKQKNIPIFLVGHVTKDGSVAGPKIIEHMVDTVLYFEGEMQNQFKILRATKNRFGSTNEIGIFEMLASGLQEVKNPSQLFLRENETNVGCAIGCLLEGTRAFLVEVQALVSPASYGNSQRVALGFDHRKLALILAVIEKNLSINLRNNDVFLNLAGGMKVMEPALDLSIIAAILSSAKDTPLPAKTMLLGEVGLNGEIRAVSQAEKRIKEAIKLGYENIIVSARTKNVKSKITKLKHIRQLFPVLFGK